LWSVIYKTQFATSQKLVTLDFHINVLLELLKYKWIAHLPYKLKLLGWIGWCMQLNMVSERSWVRILFHVQAFFFEYAGELSIFEFKEKNSPITKHHTPPWTRMGIMNKGLKNELLQIKLHERPDPQLF